MTELLRVALSGAKRATVYSDNHRSYPAAIRQCGCEQVTHLVTSSRDYRDRNNQLWEANLLEVIIRHSSANHRRETIAWSKRRQASAEHLAILGVWRNYIKGRREKDRASPTPAMARGLLGHRCRLDEVLAARIFRTHVDLPPRWGAYYDRTVRTRALGRHRTHALKYAY
jgi:hypothetical protein